MSSYFFDMIPASEKEQLNYIPTVPEFLTWIETKYSDKPAVSDLEVTYSYKEMCARIARRRTVIANLGLEKGSKIAIFDRNTIDAVELFLAVTTSGMVAINLPASLPEPAVTGSCRRFDVAAIFVREEFRPMCSQLDGLGIRVLPTTSMSDTETPVTPVDKEDTAAIFFTGGTTGAPKGAVLPHRALMRGSFNGCFMPGSVLSEHRYIGILPLSHVFGLIRGTMSVFYTGALWFSCEDMKATIGKLPVIKPTCLVLVPGICDILNGLAKMYGPQFLGGELKTIISGAANVPPRLISEFDKLGIQLLDGYGMTEGANLTSGNADVKDRPTSVGKLYDGQEAKIVDGELWIKGDNLFTGYYKDEANTAAALTSDGWLRTGDLARIDEDGYLYIVGRIKNLIILSNGENVSPEEIEEPFYASPFVKDALVREDTKDGMQCISIEILPQIQAFAGKSDEEIKAFMEKLVEDINRTLPTTHRIAKVTVRKEDFKRTGSMKVARV
ncbi:MAG: acyl--CoA ligase [Bacteroidaceae bacterium]|nr:acyl--CoA ligase [Bacteroidaceae bacterium]